MTKQRENYFSPGPAPTTERGKRRHANRNDKQREHANSVHVPREDWVASQAFTPCGLGQPTL